MESTIRNIDSPSLQKPISIMLLEKLDKTIDDAKDIRDSIQAGDPEIRLALQIVESFLRKRHLICYGGMAINNHLPKEKQFYNLKRTIPDYDFFSPNYERDVKDLVELLEAANFESVSPRLSVHEGTTSIYVNFVSIADITHMPLWKFNILKKRAIQVDGIYYVDADFLRLGMYLELSRPRGEVERWDKVYKRLHILNNFVPPKMDKKTKMKANKIVNRDILLDYCVSHSLIYCGSDLADVYADPSANPSDIIEKSKVPILGYVNDVEYHCKILQKKLIALNPESNVKMEVWKKLVDLVPQMAGIRVDGVLTCLLVDQEFCYSYNIVSLSDGAQLRIGTLDTIIALYYSLEYVNNIDGLVSDSILNFARGLVITSIKTRDSLKQGKYPLFSLTCAGHQPSYISLLKGKIKRIRSMKRKAYKKKGLTKRTRNRN